ncbi:MAG TPA: HEAT repeat domain-containing protein [Candidatus Omnitrophica bacterium]|nr:HEAT repeat domain-containing protein [Candidatus Omnitrophota bacterium]
MGRVEELKENLKDEDYSKRRYAAEELGRLQAKEAVPELIQLLKDSNWDVRKAGASALGNIGEKEAVPALLPLLKDPDWFVREAVAIALGRLGDKSAVPALQESLKDEVYSVKKAADAALQSLGAEIEKVPIQVEQKALEKRPEQKIEEKRDTVILAVRELGASFETLENGFNLKVEVGKGRSQKVEVRFEEGQIVYRSGCGPATPNNYLWALKANYTMKYGSLAVVEVDSNPCFVVIERQLEETADREEIRKALWSVATFADWVEEALTREDKR